MVHAASLLANWDKNGITHIMWHVLAADGFTPSGIDDALSHDTFQSDLGLAPSSIRAR